MNRHYFDYAASTPVDPAVVRAMASFWGEKFGNPGSLHSFGQEASAAVFEARDTIAKSLGCHYSEIVFTGSATEANNLAMRGIVGGMATRIGNRYRQAAEFAKPSHDMGGDNYTTKPKIIVSAIEHDSILDTAKELEKDGVEVVYLPVLKNGIADLKKLESALDERTILVSIMYANNEIGTVQPITKISEIIRNFRNSKSSKLTAKSLESAYPLFHCDAVQAFNYLNCNVNDLGVDLLTLSSQKIYGPKGVGLLYMRRNSKHEALNPKQIQNSKFQKNKVSDFGFRISDLQLVAPIVTGGGQERGLRSGTENVPGIVGFAKAVKLVAYSRELETKRLRKLQEYFLKQVKKINSKIELNGDAKNRLPNNINLYIPAKSGKDPSTSSGQGTAQDLVIALDIAGFAVSPGSACSARVCSPSHVLKALGHSDEKAMSGLRITFGRQTDKKSIDLLLGELKKKLK